MLRTHGFRLAGLALLLVAVSVQADTTKVLDKTTTGTPAIQKIDVIRFGPSGTLSDGSLMMACLTFSRTNSSILPDPSIAAIPLSESTRTKKLAVVLFGSDVATTALPA